jgi:hypothetical protein
MLRGEECGEHFRGSILHFVDADRKSYADLGGSGGDVLKD